MKYVIDRSKWACALNTNDEPRLEAVHMKHIGDSMLLNDKGRMCCLGQCSSQSGVSDRSLDGVGTPTELRIIDPVTVDRIDWMCDNDIASVMMGVNDSEWITEDQREAQLIELAAQAGHELEFTGELLTLEQWRGEG